MKDNELVKYPRTMHFPWSPGATNDDKYASTAAISHLSSGIELVVSEKFDGGNVTFTRKNFYSRSLDSGTHSWDTRAKALWAKTRYSIPEGWRVSGESLYAQRSIKYEHLDDIYLVFGIWDETNTLLSWDDTVLWAELLGLYLVKQIYRGTNYDEAVTAWGKSHDDTMSEGFVMRATGKIHYDDFPTNVAKWVRENHVTTDASWRGRDDWKVNSFK